MESPDSATDDSSQPDSVEAAASSTLAAVDESWQRALCVVAHPDDMEFGGAAAVARWTGQGKEVTYVMVTSGEAGIDSMSPDAARPVREAEQVESARIVGVETVEFLGLPDGVVEYGVELRRVIAEQVRRHRPEIVITLNFADAFGPGMLNQPDHVAVGRAVVDAVRDAGNRWIFAEQVADGLEPWQGVRQVWVLASPDVTHAVDTTATFDVGVDSLKAHAAYLDGLGWGEDDARSMLERFSREAGERLGTQYAAGIEVIVVREDPAED